MSWGVLAYTVVCVFVAAVVRGLSGFGFALMTIISLSLLIPPVVTVPAMFMLEVVAGIHLLPAIRHQVRWRSIAVLVVAAVACTPVGVYLLATVPEAWMKIALSLVVILASLLLLRGFRMQRMPNVFETAATGVAAGILNGALGISGPPVILFFLSSPLAAAAGRASIIASFLVMDVAGLPPLFLFGLVTWKSVTLFLACLAPLGLGVWLGSRLAGRWEEAAVRRILLLILIVMALAIGAQGLATLGP